MPIGWWGGSRGPPALCTLTSLQSLDTAEATVNTTVNAPARWGNPLLEQKPPLRSNTCTTSRGLHGPLTCRRLLWITGSGRALGPTMRPLSEELVHNEIGRASCRERV